MDIRQFMKGKCLSDSRSVKDNSDKRLQKRVLFSQYSSVAILAGLRLNLAGFFHC